MSDIHDPDDVLNRILSFQDSNFSSFNLNEKKLLLQILQEIADSGESGTYEQIWLADYKEIPVSIDTFLDDNQFLGIANNQGSAIFPFWRNAMEEIFYSGNRYEEVFLTGATRTGKSSTGVTCTAYMLYKLMCLKNPQLYFEKKSISKFSVLFFNLTLQLAKGVAYSEFNTLLSSSPWFQEHGVFTKATQPEYIPEGNKIEVSYGSDASQALGKQVYCGFCDEMNFMKSGMVDSIKAKNHMEKLFTTVVDRVRGSFAMNGQVYGKIFAISSKNSDSDYMEELINKQKASDYNYHMFVADRPRWEVQPASNFHKEVFYVAVGDRYHHGFIVDNPSERGLQELRDQGYTIITPPIDFLSTFQNDFDRALRDVAGISVPGSLSFISQDILNQCIDRSPDAQQNPFENPILEIGQKDSYSIEGFWHDDRIGTPEYVKALKRYPLYIHLDLSETTDKSGIGGVCVSNMVTVEDKDGNKFSVPYYTHVFSVDIKAPRGDRVPYLKIQEFLMWLRAQHWNIQGISRDQYQSAYMGELLEHEGFNVTKLSLDRTPDGYLALRNTLTEKRISMLNIPFLEDELIWLQRDSHSGKIDHLEGRCFTGDTEIALVDGRNISIEDLMREQQYKDNWVYTVNESNHRIEPQKIVKVWQTMLTTTLVEVTLDNGTIIHCTPNHKFMLRDGSYEQICNLSSGDSLMPLYIEDATGAYEGYDKIYDPFDNKWKLLHREFCSNVLEDINHVVHHKNFNKKDNRPTNLVCITRTEYTRIHKEYYRGRTFTLEQKQTMQANSRKAVQTKTIGKNHKITSIKYIHKPCKVYDIEVENNHNFALAAGIFVHNSKDMSDGFAGAVWNGMLSNKQPSIPSNTKAKAMAAVNAIRASAAASGSNSQLDGIFGRNSIRRL